MNTDILNQALDLALAWGPDWLKPTQPRLKKVHPTLTDAELDDYDKQAQAAMRVGFGHLYDHPDDAYAKVEALVRAQHPWVSDDNLKRVYSQGQYYAHK